MSQVWGIIETQEYKIFTMAHQFAGHTLPHTHTHFHFPSYLEPDRDLLPKPFRLPSLRDDGSSLEPPCGGQGETISQHNSRRKYLNWSITENKIQSLFQIILGITSASLHLH